jgi:hypothetical protein
MKKPIIFLIIFITGLHNKPQGCGASVAAAAGPFTTKKTLKVLARVVPDISHNDTHVDT